MKSFIRRRTGVVLSLVVVSVVSVSGCGGSDTVANPTGDFITKVEPQIQRVVRSAEITQRTLARVSAPNQLPSSRTLLIRQLDLVDEVRAGVSKARPGDDAARPAYVRLNAAVTAHRRYLVQLTRAMGQTGGTGLSTLSSAENLATATTRSWSKVAADGSRAAESIAAAEIGDMSGVRTALRAEAAQSAAQREAARRAEAAEAARREALRTTTPDYPSDAVPSVSMSEARAMTEQAWIMIQNGRYSEAEYLSERALTALAGSGDDREGNAYYNLGLSRLQQGRCGEALGPLSESMTKTGTAQQMKVRSDTYAQAQRCA